jgi:branched-chain amino acid aminotransferase
MMKDDLIIYLDGNYLKAPEAKISVFDHGLLYGDGIFEGIRVYNGRIFLLQEHLDRLYDSAKAILLKVPLDSQQMREMVIETCRRNLVRDGYIRLVVTRGTGYLGLSPDRCEKASVFCIAAALELYPAEAYTKGLVVRTVPTQRVSQAALSPSIKSLNYLNNIMAKVEATQAGAQEALMLNAEGYVAECSGDNVFAVKKGIVFTPPVSAGALNGITRRCAIEIVRHIGKEVREMHLTRYDLFVADEIFLTGTGAEIVPVIEIDGRVIGDGTPGKITKDCMRRFADMTQTTGTMIYQGSGGG